MPIRLVLAVLVLAPLLLLAACGDCETSDDGSMTPPPASQAGRYELGKAATLSVGVDEAGAPVIEVVIPEGAAGAGTYTSSSANLLAAAQAALELMGNEGVTVHIEVDEAGEIVKLGQSVVLK